MTDLGGPVTIMDRLWSFARLISMVQPVFCITSLAIWSCRVSPKDDSSICRYFRSSTGTLNTYSVLTYMKSLSFKESLGHKLTTDSVKVWFITSRRLYLCNFWLWDWFNSTTPSRFTQIKQLCRRLERRESLRISGLIFWRVTTL